MRGSYSHSEMLGRKPTTLHHPTQNLPKNRERSHFRWVMTGQSLSCWMTSSFSGLGATDQQSFFLGNSFYKGTYLRVRTAVLVASFVIAYFLWLTYAISIVSTYFGLVEYSALLFLAAVVGILAVKYKTRFGAAFLIFFNVSRIFFLGVGVTFLLNTFGIVNVPLSNVNVFGNFSGSWLLTFGVYAILNFAYVFGFSDRKQKYTFFSWVRDTRQVGGAN